ncbi:MAG: alpha/beta hydrolase domain-containing protein [Myxococcota bacterium]
MTRFRATRARQLRCGIAALALAHAASALPAARVERFEIRARADAFGGASFGAVGPYERIDAVAHVSLDPAHAANRAIVDLALAPRDARGRVANDADVTILRPKNAGGANRTLLFDVPNRGNRLAHAVLAEAARGATLEEAAGAGNGFALKRGYTLAWAGWQADIVGAGLMSARFPIATTDGAPITGRVQLEVVFDNADQPGRIALPYPAASLEPARASLTVRQRQGDAPRALPASALRFADARTLEVTRPADVDAGAIYELVYLARDPVVTGLGFAAARDVVSFLRFAASDASGAPNPLAGQVDRALAIGFSQSGRYLRDWLWQGFHVDGEGRVLFDGVLPVIAGARKTYTNFRWGQPGRFSRQHEEQRVPGNQFPFAYALATDAVTAARDGIFARCEQTKTCPKLMHVDTSAEFWQAGASLVGTDGAGHDVAFPENVRAYLLAGASHAPGMVAPYCELPANPVSYGAVVRALLVAMERWVRAGETPPASVWPSLARGELVAPPESGPPANTVPRVDYAQVPPKLVGVGWRVLVPSTDPLGNDAPGIPLHALQRLPAAYLGWNVRRAGFAAGELCFLFGGMKPIAVSYRGEPRPKNPIAVAEELANEGYLLSEDRDAISRAALPLLR